MIHTVDLFVVDMFEDVVDFGLNHKEFYFVMFITHPGYQVNNRFIDGNWLTVTSVRTAVIIILRNVHNFFCIEILSCCI